MSDVLDAFNGSKMGWGIGTLNQTFTAKGTVGQVSVWQISWYVFRLQIRMALETTTLPELELCFVVFQ